MKKLLAYPSFLLLVLPVGLCAALAGQSFAKVVATKLAGRLATASGARDEIGVPAGTERAVRDVPPDRSGVVARNLFCSTCKSSALLPAASATEGASEIARSSSPLVLVATLTSDEAGWSFALLQDPRSGRASLYRETSPVDGDATLVEIDERRVLLERGGRLELIELCGGSREGASPSIERAAGAADPLSEAVRSLGEGRYEIKRAALESLLRNPAPLARLRIIPSFKDGAAQGVVLRNVGQGLFQRLGMRDGDLVHAVNGNEVKTPEAWLEVYTRLRQATHVSLSFDRAGKTLTHDFTIR